MKKHLSHTLILSILLSNVLFANELSWVDEQIQAIKPSRKGISEKEIRQLKNPFIYLKKKDEKTEKNAKKTVSVTPDRIYRHRNQHTFTLEATMNQSALIHGKWYKVGSVVNGYKIIKIMPQSVILTKHKKRLILSMKSKKTNLKFSK